jgi:hypothetical protein
MANKLISFLCQVDNINTKKILITYLFYALIIILCSIVYGYFLNIKFKIYDENYNIIFDNISFSNGELIKNLYFKGEYYVHIDKIKFVLAKTPAIPLLIYFISLISKNFFFIIIFKNILIFTVYFYFILKIIAKINKSFFFLLTLLMVPIFIPYNFSVSLNFFYEDSLIAIFLPLIFLATISNYKYKYEFIGVIIFILYFIKTSTLPIAIIIPILIIFLEKKITRFIPIICTVTAILTWGLYGLNKTGRFPVFNSSSSVNSYVLSSVMNINFHKYYPNKSTDLIPATNKLPQKITDEWEFYDFYKQENDTYLYKNFDRYVKDIIIKLKFIFFGINRDGAFPDNYGNFDNNIRFSSIISKAILNLSILISLFYIVKNFKKLNIVKTEIYFLSFIILSLLPHILVWATSKHLVAISNISLIYLLFKFFKKNNA